MRIRNWELILLALAAVSLLLWGLARTVGSSAVSREGVVSRIARPGVAFWNEPVDVELRIHADRLPSCTPVTNVEPIYVALVIDHSGSMTWNNALSEARHAASDFVDLMDLREEGDAVAVVMFDIAADLVSPFSYDRTRVVRAIQSIPGGGSTNIAAGLALGAQQFLVESPPSNARRVLILLSDGQSDPGAAIAAADQAKAQGIRVVTIALGSADRYTLAQIASSESDFYETADPATLMEIYGEIAAGMVGTAATDVSIEEFYNDRNFELTGGLYRAEQTDNKIVWEVPFVGQRGRSVGYFLRPLSLGVHRVSPTAGQMSLVDCNGQILAQPTPDGPLVAVLFPVWLLFIAPALAAMWLLYRIVHSLIPVPHEPTARPGDREGIGGSGQPIEPVQEKRKPQDIQHDKINKPPMR